jgi:hypothetical protein
MEWPEIPGDQEKKRQAMHSGVSKIARPLRGSGTSL